MRDRQPPFLYVPMRFDTTPKHRFNEVLIDS